MNIKDFDSFGTADAGCHWCGHQACLGPSAGWYWTGQARSSLPAQPLELTRYDSVSFCTQILRGGSGSGARMDVVDTVSFVKPKDSGCPRDAENFYLNRVPKVNDTIRACGSSYKMDYHQPGVCSGLIEDDAGPIHQALRTTTGLWRPGTDMYCGGASHYGNCPTTSLDWGSPDDCSGYPSVIQESWHNDNIDDMALQFRQLAIDVSAMIRSGTIASAQSWADEAIAWIDKLVRMACNAYVWEEALEIWRNEGYADNKAWCCPINRPEDMPDQEAALCGDYSGPGESISIDPTGMPTGGTVLHDIACMDWNIGNPGKFAACETHCRRVCAEKCGENAGDCKNGTDGETGCEEQCSAETCVGNCEERYPAGTQRNNCISDCNNNSDSCEESCAEACEEARLACCTACGLGPGEEGGACSNEIINDSWYDMPEECDSEACTSPEDGACSDEASFPRAENYSDMNLAAAYNGGVGPGGCSNWFVDTEHTGYGLSKNQRAKFRKRKEYLEKAVEAVDSYMRPQFLRLAQTIDSQIPALIAALRRYLNALCDRNSGLRPLTYMWQGKAPREGVPGLWHKVEVKAWAPGACQMGSCGASTLPWVKTYKKSHGMKRCYEIWQGPSSHNELSGGGGGTVGVTVTRWDENPSGWLGFANGLGLWKMNGRGAYRAEDAIEQGGGGACIGSCADPGVTWGRSYSRTQRARYSLSGNHFVVRLLN
ncbi:MAG: hypothetical protein GX606_02815 [Elusimicrobia bacterium]|nr:hypothetical protein [Elusimicrobiota bacterium]